MRVELNDGSKVRQPVRIGLLRYGSDIVLAVVDDEGEIAPGGYLLQITKDGEFFKHHCVNPKYGFKLDDNGAIVINP